MNLSLFGKIGLIFKYMFSSFLSIEILVLSLLLFCILLFSINSHNKFFQLCSVGVYIGFLIGIIISYNMYVKSCFDSFFKEILNYIYFPSTIVYFFIILFVTIQLIYSIYSKKVTKVKKIINYSFFCILYFFFMSFIALASYDKVDIMDKSVLYQNDTILSIVQVSNFIFVLWILITIFYYLYKYFKRKYD